MAPEKVYPAGGPLPERKIKLGMGDVYAPKIWARMTYLFALKDTTTGEKCARALREGLSRLIADMPRFAGMVKYGPSGDPRDLLIHVDKDAHAEFEYADLSDDASLPSYAELRSQMFPYSFDLQVKLMPGLAWQTVVEGDCMTICKLVKLKGGLSMGFAINHVASDAGTLADVETLWAKHTADASAGLPFRKHWDVVTDPKEIEFLTTPKPNAPEFDLDNSIILPVASSQVLVRSEKASIEESIAAQRAARGDADDPDDVFRWAIFNISEEAVRQLRKKATRSDAPQPINRAAALGSLFWTRAAHVKQQSKDGEEDSILYFPVNIRRRLQPPLHPNLEGNVVDIMPIELGLDVLEKDESETLVSVASKISQSVNSWSQPRWEAWLNTAATLPPDQAVVPNPAKLFMSPNIIFNDYSRTPTNLVSWGADFGVIDRMRYPRPATGPATAVRVHPMLPDRSLEISVTGTGPVLEALAKDPVFSQYAKLVCYPA